VIESQFVVTWSGSGAKAQCAPNPRFPEGVDLDTSRGTVNTCTAELACPAKGIGMYSVVCKRCGLRVACTTAGRPDDPRSITMPCKPIPKAKAASSAPAEQGVP
jgi:hypothetical protein